MVDQRPTVVTLLGWILFRRVFKDDPDESARFASRLFLVSAIIEVIVFFGILYGVYRLVVTGQA